ncbi:hypothetical protein N0V88_004582 [Collariella sp. IMI 366227]|nr:hypothetical protein N0V88_004582 [Collariella sp. IMI 366227]
MSVEKVCIITTDGRNLVGTLAAHDFDQPYTVERVIRTPDDGEPSAEVPLGVYIIRGENVCLVGLVDEALDASINWTEVKGRLLGRRNTSWLAAVCVRCVLKKRRGIG